MKVLLIFIFLLGASRSYEQTLNYCDYFSLKFNENESGKNKSVYFHIDINRTKKSDFERFLRSHDTRFKYLLLKYSSELHEIKLLYPDTASISTKFCKEIIESDSVQVYFNALTPNNIVTWESKNETFTIKEMLEVASMFFYCDGINETDTTIKYKICIGVNGRKEYNSGKDVLLLEAFSIEAILFYLSQSRTPGFLNDFENILNTQRIEKRNEFKDFDSYLYEMRHICYLKMQENIDLEKKLLKYYESNRTNLNFRIE